MADDLLAAAGLSKGAVDRLGDAMRRGVLAEETLSSFQQYSEAFRPALGVMLALLQRAAAPPVTERYKTIRSTVAKLRRETARLSQIQDIAGCRVVVSSVREQNRLTDHILRLDYRWRKFDRRDVPSHGYRAVHIITTHGGLSVEVQIRTELQHQWAALSEAWDRRYEGVKYGGWAGRRPEGLGASEPPNHGAGTGAVRRAGSSASPRDAYFADGCHRRLVPTLGMKFFVLIYDWTAKRLVQLTEYEPGEFQRANQDRHDAEVRAMREGRDDEIVLLVAESLEALKRTHGSYFYTVEEIVEELRRLAS